MLKRCAESFVTSRDCSLAFAAIETAGSSRKIHYWAWESLRSVFTIWAFSNCDGRKKCSGGSKSLNGEVAKIPFTHYNRDRFDLVWFGLLWLGSARCEQWWSPSPTQPAYISLFYRRGEMPLLLLPGIKENRAAR